MEEKILMFGKYKIDVSDIAHVKEVHAQQAWYDLQTDPKHRKKKVIFYSKKIDEIGAYLITEKLSDLKQQYEPKEAWRQWFIRKHIINRKFISNMKKSQHKEYADWLSVLCTGFTVDQNNTKKKIEMGVIEAIDLMQKMTSMPQEKCVEYITTSLKKQVTELSTLKANQLKP